MNGAIKPTLEQYRCAIELAAEDQLFFFDDENGNIEACVLMNDVFYPAADAETIGWGEIPELHALVKSGGWPAAVKWVAERRKMEPRKRVKDRMNVIAAGEKVVEAAREIDMKKWDRDLRVDDLKAALAEYDKLRKP